MSKQSIRRGAITVFAFAASVLAAIYQNKIGAFAWLAFMSSGIVILWTWGLPGRIRRGWAAFWGESTLVGPVLPQMPARINDQARETAQAPPARGTSAKQLPKARPKIVPVRYGTIQAGQFPGLVILNEGESAYDVSVCEAEFAGNRVQFGWTDKPRLSSEDGPVHYEVVIHPDDYNNVTGNGLFDLMRNSNTESIDVAVKYKDADNRWYQTDCKLERDVYTSGGIAARMIGQKLISPETTLRGSLVVPDVFLEWGFQYPEWKGLEADKQIFIVNRSASEFAYNIMLAPLMLHETLLFELQTELAPNGKIPLAPRIYGKDDVYRPLVAFFVNPANTDVADRRGWIIKNKTGLAEFRYSMPSTLTYSGPKGKCERRIQFDYDTFNGCRFKLCD